MHVTLAQIKLSFKSSYLHGNENAFLSRRRIPFVHIVVWTIYTSHIDHLTPQHTAFEQSAACLSVFLELLPGSIPFAIL